MKYIYFITTITVMMTNLFLHSMEVEMPAIQVIRSDMMMQLLGPTNPAHVAFLENNIVAIAGNNGLVFFDLKTQRYTHHQQKNKIDDFAVNIPKTKVATSCNGFLTVYNTQTQQSEWDYICANTHTPITFNSQNDSQLFAHYFPETMLSIENTDTDNKKIEALHKTKHRLTGRQTPIACHPGGASIAYIAEVPSKTSAQPLTLKSQACVFHVMSNSENNNGPIMDLLNEPADPSDIFLSCEFSSNAQYLLIHTNKYLTLTEVFSKGNRRQLFDDYIASAFHPSNEFFVILTSNNRLQYWNCKDFIEWGQSNQTSPSRPLKIITLSKNAEKKEPIYKITKRIAFSPDGKYLIVALIDRCIVMPVPF